MKINNKLSLLAILLLLAGGSAKSLYAAGCAGPVPYGNVLIPTYGPMAAYGTVGTDSVGAYWVLGIPATNGNACPLASYLVDFGGGAIQGDWGNGCNTACPGSPPPVTVVTAGVISLRTAEGAVGHAGQYVATALHATVSGDFNHDLVTNGNGGAATCPTANPCQVRPIAVPVLTLVSTDPGAGSTYNVATGTGLVRFTLPQPAINGFFDAAPLTPVITGYEIFKIENANPGTIPVTSTRGAWTSVGTMANTDCVAAVCSKLINTTVGSGNVAYFSVGLIFDNGAATSAFLSANGPGKLAGPTGTSGLPSRVEVFNTTTGGRLPGVQVRWTTTNEAAIAGFNILASKAQGGVYKQINSAQIAAVGNPNTYLQTVSNRTFIAALGPASTVYLKLVTVLRDGTTREVGPVSFALTGIDREPPVGKGAGARQR